MITATITLEFMDKEEQQLRDKARESAATIKEYVTDCIYFGLYGNLPSKHSMIINDNNPLFHLVATPEPIKDSIIEQVLGEKCESGCDEPVTHYDNENIPLCENCWNALCSEVEGHWAGRVNE